MHYEGKQKKPMYILSLDNSRIIWLISIATLVFVFLFLLGYWIGRDTSDTGVQQVASERTAFQDDLLALQREMQLGSGMQSSHDPLISSARPDSGVPGSGALSSMERSGESDSRELRPQDFASADEQREFESLLSASGASSASRPAREPSSSATASASQSAAPSSSGSTASSAATPSPSPSPAKSTSSQTPAAQSQSSAPAVSGTDAASSTGRFAVQVASLGTRNSADRLADTLKAEGYRAYVSPATVSGKQYFRVKVGNYDSYRTAKQQMERLRGLDAGRESFVVEN